MIKGTVAGIAVLSLVGTSIAVAQRYSAWANEKVSVADVGTLTDARVGLVKAALQLTPEQEKYWPAIEGAIRGRAKNLEARIASVSHRLAELHDRSPIEGLRDRNPVDFMRRRADALSQRSADLKKLADAWEPLYQALSPEQRRRMGFLTLLVLREMRDAVEQRHVADEDDDEG